MDTDAPARTSLQLVRDRDFGIVFWGKGSNLIANWAFTVITVIVAYDLTGSPVWSGAASAAQMAPQMMLTLLSGRLSDSHGERRLIVAGGLVSGLPCIVLALWFWLAGDRGLVAVIALLVCTFVSGCGMALSAPALQSIVTRLVRPEELSTAVSLNFFPMALARTIGPAGGALLLIATGPAVSVLIVGAVLVLTALCVHLARLPGLVREGDSDTRIWAAVRYVFRDRVILACLLGVAAVGAGSEPAITLAPALADSVGRQDATGLIVAAFGAGGGLGIFVHRILRIWLSSLTEGIVAMCALAGTVALVSWVGGLELMLAVMVVAGCSMVTCITAVSITVQMRCELSMLGRVMAMWVFAFAGIRPIAALGIAYVTEKFTLPVGLLSSSAILAIAALLVLILVRGQSAGQRRTKWKGQRATSTQSSIDK